MRLKYECLRGYSNCVARVLPHDSNYVDARLKKAVESLRGEETDVRQRLLDAFGAIRVLESVDLPSGPLRVAFDFISDRMYSGEEPEPPPGQERLGNVRYALRELTDQEAKQLANDILALAADYRSVPSAPEVSGAFLS